MSSADLCQVNGLGLSFQVSAQLRISAADNVSRCSPGADISTLMRFLQPKIAENR